MRDTDQPQVVVGTEAGGLAWPHWPRGNGAWRQMQYLPGMVTLYISGCRMDKEGVMTGRQKWRREVEK